METDDLSRKWRRRANTRRLALLILILLPTCIATGYMAYVLPQNGPPIINGAVLFMFAILYAWIAVGFWTAMAGWMVLMKGLDKWSISWICREGQGAPVSRDFRTAVIMPICNEDVNQVTAGISAAVQSLAATGRGDAFDIFILSDPGDPDIWVREEIGWAELKYRHREDPVHIYYRRRRNNAKRKSGNVADFCRRWGKNYRYLIVLDADSIMSGKTMVEMVRMMECRPRIGILQTAPQPVNRQTLVARTQQFAGSVYGPMFAAGLNFWLLGDSQFWGHNAIIRVEPFMTHCALPRLSGRPPLGGDILSHDFVESALMRRSGYEVWMGYDLEGSFEEPPPTLLEELKRDRRWCQGNLQHLRLLFTRGIQGAHRALFLNGALAYGSALLWFLFLAASTALAAARNLREPDYFPSGRSLFPSWPVWEPQWALVLLASTAILLFLPKLCGFLYIRFKKKQVHLYGGSWRLAAGILLEIVISTLLAPTRMLFHARFVFLTLVGRQISWEAQQRADVGTSWGEALKFHWGETVFAMVWGGGLYMVNRSFFWWISPILISLALSIPLSVWLSQKSAGLGFRRAGLLVIPEEAAVQAPLSPSNRQVPEDRDIFRPLPGQSEAAGFIRAVVDPGAYSLHLGMSPGGRHHAGRSSVYRKHLGDKALLKGPQSLSASEKGEILSDPALLSALHRKVWELSDPESIRSWQLGPDLTF